MTDKPKSFTTEIEWFSPFEKLPENVNEVLVVHSTVSTSAYSRIMSWPYDPESKLFTDGFITALAYICIKYWAYLPRFSEVIDA